MVRFGRSAAQILQNGPRQLGLLGCAPCSPSGGPFWPLSSPNPSKRTSPPWSVVRFGRSAAQIRQNGLPLALPTSSASVPLSPCCSVFSAERPKSSKTVLASCVCLAVLLAVSLVVRFGGFGAAERPKTDHQRESKEHSQADQAGDARFGGFGLLSSQNGPPEGEQGAQPSRPSWRCPFWRIWAAGQRPTASSRVMRLPCLCAHRNMDVIIPPHPHPTPPHPTPTPPSGRAGLGPF